VYIKNNFIAHKNFKENSVKKITLFASQLCVVLMVLFIALYALVYVYYPEKTTVTLDEEVNMLSIKTLDDDIKRADQDTECLNSILYWNGYLYHK
jgi:hypothetical protein